MQSAVAEPRDRSLAAIATLLTLSWLAFCWPWLSGAVTIPWDAKAQFQPQVQFLAASIARGELPFWTPYAFAGHPQIADPQSMIFSPPMLLLALIDPAPSLWAVDATVLLSVFFGGVGVVLLCRELGWHWAAVLIAALAFQFGGVMAWRIQHFGQVLSMVYLPFALFFLRRALDRSSPGYGAAAGLFAAFIALGRDQVALLSLYLLAGYAVWLWLTAASPVAAAKASIKPLACAAASSLLVAAIPIALTALLAGQSNRPEIDFIGAGRGSLHPALLLTAAIPDLFGAAGKMEIYWGPPSYTWTGTDLFTAQNVGELYLGAIPLLLLVVGFCRGVLWSRDVRFFSISALLILLYALGWYTPVFRIAYDVLPGVSLYRRPADALFLVGGLGALLAGYVAHRMLSRTLPQVAAWRRRLEAVLVLLIFGLALAFALHFDRLGAATAPMLQSTAFIGIGAVILFAVARWWPARPMLMTALLVGFSTVDLAINNGPNGATAMPPSALEFLEPDTENETVRLLQRKVQDASDEVSRPRVELAGVGFHWPGSTLTHGLEHTLGYNPVRLKLYSEATGAGDTVGLPDQRKFTPLFPSYRSQLADLLGLRFIASGVPIENIDKNLAPGDLTLVARTLDAFIYENPRALPRVLFAHEAVEGDFEAMLASGKWPADDPRTTVVLEDAPVSRARRPGKVRIVHYQNTEVVIDAESPDGGWVVLNDVWHPWWFVEVDGLPATMKRANVLFRAVEVPSGRHTLRFVFRPLAGAMREVLDRM